MSELSDKQKTFMRLLPRLIDYAHYLGFEVSIGDGYRDPRVFGQVGIKHGYGHANSCHKMRLAIDLNLFDKGEYVTTSEGHKILGEYWKSLDPLCRWGGNFSTPDGNHYSIEHDGCR